MKINKAIILIFILLAPIIIYAQSLPSENIVLNWAADTYAPHWYDGKKMPVIGSRVSAGATLLKSISGTLYYRWTVNSKLVFDWSDKAGSINFILEKDFNYVDVVVAKKIFAKSAIGRKKTDEFSILGKKTVIIKAIDGETVLYSLNNGLLSATPEEINISKGQTSDFIAIPYFFNTERITDLKFIWKFFDKTISGEDENPEKLSVSIPANSANALGFLEAQIINKDGFHSGDSARVKIK